MEGRGIVANTFIGMSTGLGELSMTSLGEGAGVHSSHYPMGATLIDQLNKSINTNMK